MRLIVIGALFLFLISTTGGVYAQYETIHYGGTKDETIFSKVADWFAMLGKTQDEKYIINKFFFNQFCSECLSRS